MGHRTDTRGNFTKGERQMFSYLRDAARQKKIDDGFKRIAAMATEKDAAQRKALGAAKAALRIDG